MKNENLHAGHRERLRKKFIENNFDSFEQHEILELLLFYSIPRINTNEIAHRLITARNYISGNYTPSAKDIDTARTLCNRLRPVGIIILDHIIISDGNVFSMHESGLLPNH